MLAATCDESPFLVLCLLRTSLQPHSLKFLSPYEIFTISLQDVRWWQQPLYQVVAGCSVGLIFFYSSLFAFHFLCCLVEEHYRPVSSK